MRLKKRISQHPRRKELEKCINWCVNSIEQKDPFDKFIALWVGFNIIYNLYDAHRNPSIHRDEYNDHRKAVQIKEIIKGSDLIKVIETKFKVIDLLKQYNISHERNDGSVVHYNVELERSYKNNDLDRAFEMFLECLYKIRCNLLHGEKERESYRQRRLLQGCNSALLLVVKNALNKYIDLSL